MTFSRSAKDMIRCDEILVLGKLVKEGTVIYYEERHRCPCCRQFGTEIESRVTGIEVYPGTGFAEVGDDMIMYLENGHMLRGDSEYGFGAIKKVG